MVPAVTAAKQRDFFTGNSFSSGPVPLRPQARRFLIQVRGEAGEVAGDG
jgi:hypothetical protein